jgi:rubrerythrin
MNDDIIYGLSEISLYLSNVGKDDFAQTVEKACKKIDMLKEQEAGFSPKEIKMYPNNVWACGNCGHVAVGSADYKAKYCPECGRAVKWDG